MRIFEKISRFFTKLDKWLQKATVAETFAEEGMHDEAIRIMKEDD